MTNVVQNVHSAGQVQYLVLREVLRSARDEASRLKVAKHRANVRRLIAEYGERRGEGMDHNAARAVVLGRARCGNTCKKSFERIIDGALGTVKQKRRSAA